MSRNTTKAGKGGPPKTPKDNLTGSSTGSSIKQYLARGGSPGSIHQEAQTSTMVDKRKKGQNGKGDQTPDQSRESSLIESAPEISRTVEHRQDLELPLKNEIAEMFKALETSIKSEISMLRTDLGNLLARVERAEDIMEQQEREISDLKEQVKITQQNQIKICYRIEDQENRSRRQNLRIHGVPEKRGEDLRKTVADIFSPLLELGVEDFPKIERVHRIGRLDTSRTERSCDIIMRFRFYADKENIWVKLRGNTPLQFEEARIQLFADLAKDTLARRRLLKPLLEQMTIQNIKYTWGFPACLLGSKDGRTARLRFPGELEEFCRKLGIQVPATMDWSNERWIELGIGLV